MTEFDVVLVKLVSLHRTLAFYIKKYLTDLSAGSKSNFGDSTLVDNIESLVFGAHKAKGWTWVHEEPMWVAWYLLKFGATSACLPVCLPPQHPPLTPLNHDSNINSRHTNPLPLILAYAYPNRGLAPQASHLV